MFGPNVGRRGRMAPNAGRNGQGIALMLMLLRQIQQLERKPPVTLGLMALMYGLHFQKQQTPELFAPYSLCPDRVISHWDLTRIVASGLIHVDDWHLYHNMISFLWKGYNLEYKLGSVRFLLTVGYLLLLCHVLVVVVALVLATGFQMPGPLHQCSVGFSGVLFALKVIQKLSVHSDESILVGVRISSAYEICGMAGAGGYSLSGPAKFVQGHMCGILAGYIFVYSPAIQSAMTPGTSALSRWLKVVLGLASNRHDTETNAASPHSPRISRPPASSFETDEELARRLQEEEYRSHQSPPSQPEQSAPESISPSELRRRRLARFGNGV
ncbi:Peptidase S54, rhomboid domain [Phytophthora cactorum]|nr:Peptidase S54, rhomboid domain [Phytophthora cactorum]